MKWSLVAVVSLALAAFAPAQAAPLEGAYRAGDYPRAIKRIGPAAERGNARAQAYLGFLYQYGRGVPQNHALAAYWYRRSAEQGNATAQHLLGLMYDKGLGVPTDHVAAHMWLSLAAARTKGAEHEDNVRLRDAVASKMSFGQLADAQYLARAGSRSRRSSSSVRAENSRRGSSLSGRGSPGDRLCRRSDCRTRRCGRRRICARGQRRSTRPGRRRRSNGHRDPWNNVAAGGRGSKNVGVGSAGSANEASAGTGRASVVAACSSAAWPRVLSPRAAPSRAWSCPVLRRTTLLVA